MLSKSLNYKDYHKANDKNSLNKLIKEMLNNSNKPALFEIQVQPGSRSDLGRPTVTPKENKNQINEKINELSKNNNYYNPVKIVETDNWINEIKLIIDSKNLNNLLIITSKGNNKRINIQNYFQNAIILDDVPPNPTIQYCDSKLSSLRSHNFDSIIAVGGGSVMDAAKLFLAGISLKEKTTLELLEYKKI